MAAGVAVGLVCAVWALRVPEPALRAIPEVRRDAVGTSQPGPIRLSDVTGQTGITFVHTHGGTGQLYIMEAMSAGVAVFDYDNDGDLDIYFPNGAPLPLGRKVEPPPRNALYRNDGGWRFTDVTEQAGVGHTGYALGVAVADYDNDGNLDFFVTNFGPDVLYRNNGDGTFTDVTAKAGVADGSKVGAGACFLDIDGDGELDLYSANYVKFSYDLHPSRRVGGYSRAPSPLDFAPEPDSLFRNNGDGTFADVSLASRVGRHAGTGMGITACDYDNDGDADVFVNNDVRPNFLFQNDGTGKFQEVGLYAGVAYDGFGKANGSMAIDAADYDRDGRIDFFMTDYQMEMPCLYRNLGGGLFEDVAMQAFPAASNLHRHVKWGAGFADFDNDGYPDLYVANGHIEPLIERIDPNTAYRVANVLLRNTRDGKFADVSQLAGDGMAVVASSRGVALDDLDNDGRVDVVVLNSDDKPTILRNETANGNHCVQVRLRGVKSNRDGIGARVKVIAGDLAQIDEVHSGRGYQSHYGMRLHFGLGGRNRVDLIEVRWIGGGVDIVQDVPADRLVTVTEGSTTSATKASATSP